MFSSIQIKQEYNSVEERNHQNMVSGHGNIDYSVFNNQNIEYSYHQLPHFWDQTLQVQTMQYPKDFSYKNDGTSRQDVSQNNQNLSCASSNYVNHHAPQQEQHNSFASNQESQVVQVNQPNMEGKHTSSVASAIINNTASMNRGLLAVQLSSAITKCNTSSRPSKSINTSSPGKKVKCQCEICFKEFGHKSNLFIHMRTHNGERPYKCKQCDKRFTHSGNLAIHMRTHSGERPYACQVCGKMFSHSGNLSTHLRTHSGIKPYKCSVCAKEFRHSGNLSIHERIHSGIKPFHCKVCGKEFYHSGNLTTHMKKHPATVSAEQCESIQFPSLSDFICNSDNQTKETDKISISNSNDVHCIMTNSNKTGGNMNGKPKTS